MIIRIRSVSDFVTGHVFIAIGVAVVWLSGDLAFGSSARMGPGFFPTLLGAILALLGLTIAARALSRPHHHYGPLDEPPFELGPVLRTLSGMAAFWFLLAATGAHGVTGLDIPVLAMLAIVLAANRRLFWLLAGIAAFGLFLESFGLVVASFALVAASAIASHDFHWKATLLSWLVLLALCLTVFVWGLGLRFPVLPPFLAS